MAELLKKKYRSRAPLRLGLGGGGTDVSPYSDNQGGSVINATIDLYAHAILIPNNNNKINFHAIDLNECFEQESISSIKIDNVGFVTLHIGVYNKIVKKFNFNNPLSFELYTYADAPPGSGLGTSSTMVVCIIKVFFEWLKINLSEYDIAQMAYEIEREDLKIKGGKQDQYASVFGGFNFIEFGPGKTRVLVNPLRINKWIINELESITILFYTGISRESSKIIADQINKTELNDYFINELMNKIKNDAILIKEYLLKGDVANYSLKINDSWNYKKMLSNNISNESLDDIYNKALNAGAVAGKISGAGGGGVFMFIVPVHKRMNVISELNNLDGRVINFHFTNIGAESWSIDF